MRIFYLRPAKCLLYQDTTRTDLIEKNSPLNYCNIYGSKFFSGELEYCSETTWAFIERGIRSRGSNKKIQDKQDPKVSIPVILAPLKAEARGLGVPGQPQL